MTELKLNFKKKKSDFFIENKKKIQKSTQIISSKNKASFFSLQFYIYNKKLKIYGKIESQKMVTSESEFDFSLTYKLKRRTKNYYNKEKVTNRK